jgi:23S rRNA (adenine2503-C2)-methyltransferase
LIKKKDIRALTKEQLRDFFIENGDKAFRGNQVYEWLWSKSLHTFEAMTNISKQTREMLENNFVINHIKVDSMQKSKDGTIKNGIKLHDGLVVESVLIPTPKRTTACVSSQVGCSLDCKFCATGKLKLLKNLSAGEIYDQVVYLKNQSEQRYDQNITNIVYMGMGEPLLNYKHVLSSIDKLCSEEGLNISPKRITVSTAGIAKMIKKLGDDEVKFNLALSLHAANDKKRSEIMEINDSNDLATLAEALKYFYERTKTRVTFEYIIFKDFNDEIEDAVELAQFAKHIPCKINIIEYNPIDEGGFQQADPKKVDAFAAYLETRNLVVNVRRSRGKDIDAACGQLANKNDAILKEERILKK